MLRRAMSTAAAAAGTHGPVGTRIMEKLAAAFRPAALELVNESHRHSVPRGSESHFKVFLVSEAFEGKSVLDRHRMVNEALAEELAGEVHALSISAKTPAQADAGSAMHSTPSCRGGSKADAARS